MNDVGGIELQTYDTSKRLLYINDVIDSNLAKEFTEKLNEIDFEDMMIMRSNLQKLAMFGVNVDTLDKPPIKVFMNSPGGHVYDALSIYDMISDREDIICICSGKVMSAATFILLAFNEKLRYATKNTTFMIHSPSSFLYGKLKDMVDDVNETKRLDKIITDIYLKRSKIPKALLTDIYKEKKDYFFTAKEALKYGMIDKII